MISDYSTALLIRAEMRGKMKITPPAHHPGEPLAVSVNEAARLTGLSAATLRRRHKNGGLPLVRLGRRTLIRLDDLRRLLSTEGTSSSNT